MSRCNCCVYTHCFLNFLLILFLLLFFLLPHLVSLSVAQINQYLDDLALSNVKKDRMGTKRALQVMLRNTSAQEQKWLIRIIMKVIAGRCKMMLSWCCCCVVCEDEQ